MSDKIHITAAAVESAIGKDHDGLRRFAFAQPTATLGQCRSGDCNAPIFWGDLNGNPHPFNLDGSSHFSTCPDAERWRQISERRRMAQRNQMNLLDAIDAAGEGKETT